MMILVLLSSENFLEEFHNGWNDGSDNDERQIDIKGKTCLERESGKWVYLNSILNWQVIFTPTPLSMSRLLIEFRLDQQLFSVGPANIGRWTHLNLTRQYSMNRLVGILQNLHSQSTTVAEVRETESALVVCLEDKSGRCRYASKAYVYNGQL